METQLVTGSHCHSLPQTAETANAVFKFRCSNLHQELSATSVQNKPPAEVILAAHLDQTVGLQLEA